MMDNGRYNSVVWLYMVRRSFLKGTGISFYNGIIHEDELFSTSLFLKCRSVFCIRKVLVTHRIRTGSTMGTGFTRRNLDCYMTVADEIKKLNGGRTAERYLGFMLPIVFYTGHLIPLKDKLGLFARAVKSGYMGYIGLKSILVFWLKGRGGSDIWIYVLPYGNSNAFLILRIRACLNKVPLEITSCLLRLRLVSSAFSMINRIRCRECRMAGSRGFR